jgi:hypothetical protein
MAWKSVMWAVRKLRVGGKYLERREVRNCWEDLSRVSVRIKGFGGWGGGIVGEERMERGYIRETG